MAIAFVQDAENTGSTTTLSVTWGVNTTSGNCLFAAVSLTRSSGSNVTCTAPAGWLTAGTAREGSTGSGRTYLFYYPNCPAQAATGNFTASNAGGISIVVAEFSGLKTSSVIDQTGTHTNDADTTDTVALSGSTTQNDELVVAAFGGEASATFSNPTNSFTLQEQAAQTDSAVALSYRIVTSQSAYSTGITSDTSIDFGDVIASFKAAASVDPAEDVVYVPTAASFVRARPQPAARQQSSESTFYPLQEAALDASSLTFDEYRISLPVRIPRSIQPAFSIGQEIPDYQDVQGGMAWEAIFARRREQIAPRTHRVNFDRPIDSVPVAVSDPQGVEAQLATSRRIALTRRVQRVQFATPLIDIVDVADDMPWEALHPISASPIPHREYRPKMTEGGEPVDDEYALPLDATNVEVRLPSVRPARQVRRATQPTASNTGRDHEVVVAWQSGTSRRIVAPARPGEAVNSPPPEGLQDDSELMAFRKAESTRPRRLLPSGQARHEGHPSGQIEDVAVYASWPSAGVRRVRAERRQPSHHDQVEQFIAALGMVDADAALTCKAQSTFVSQRHGRAQPDIDYAWLNVVIVYGPYYVTAGDIYHAGAVAGDVQTE